MKDRETKKSFHRETKKNKQEMQRLLDLSIERFATITYSISYSSMICDNVNRGQVACRGHKHKKVTLAGFWEQADIRTPQFSVGPWIILSTTIRLDSIARASEAECCQNQQKGG